MSSHFAYGPVPAPRGYARNELFYRHAFGASGGRVRAAAKLAEHVPDMLRYRRHARAADVVHFQWLPVQALDRHLLPGGGRTARRRGHAGGAGVGAGAGDGVGAGGAGPDQGAGGGAGDGAGAGGASGAGPDPGAARGRPALVLTAHDILPREPRPGQLRAQRLAYERFDAIVVHSHAGRARLVGELGVDPERVHVIPHGAFTYLAEQDIGPARPDGSDAARVGGSDIPHETAKLVVLMFGLLRPYKGIDVLLRAWRGVDGQPPIADAELWIAGLPKMDLRALRAAAPAGVRFDARFIDDRALPGYFERADLVVLPYLRADQSGVLFTALAFGKPLLLSDVGGFPELARDTGAARVVPAGDARALGAALRELLADRAALAEMCVKARAAAEGDYSWESVARAHMALYRSL